MDRDHIPTQRLGVITSERPARDTERVTVPKHDACCDGGEGSACDVALMRDGMDDEAVR